MTLDAVQPHLDAWRVSALGEPGDCDKILFVGEDNPQSSDPFFALWPAPERCAGDRLCNVILRIPEDWYTACWRTNLCHDGPWSTKRARERAKLLLTAENVPWTTIVVLGAKVAKIVGSVIDLHATGGELKPFRPVTHGNGHVVYLPHPSGRNLAYNSQAVRDNARDALRTLAPRLWRTAE